MPRPDFTASNSTATLKGVTRFLEVTRATVAELDAQVLESIVDSLFEAWRSQRKVFVMGNGGSASTATHFACDLAKYTIAPDKPRFRVIALTDNAPLVSAWTNDTGFGSIFAEQMLPWQEPGDILVGFSVHGGSGEGDAGPWSQNMVRAIEQARGAGMRVIGFSGYDGGAMARLADHCLVVPVLEDQLGTPVVESVHVVAHHLVVHMLRERLHAA